MSNEAQNQGDLILHNKDVTQLMSLANLDIKQSKTSIMKVNISEALALLHRASTQVDMRLYGNIIYAITKGIQKKYNLINYDLKDIIDMIRRTGQAKVREEKAQKKKVVVNIPQHYKPFAQNYRGTEPSDEGSQASIERPRHISSKEKITLVERPTPGLTKGGSDIIERSVTKDLFGDFSDVGPGPDFGEQLISEKGLSEKGGEAPFEARQFELSTPSRLGEYLSPEKLGHVIGYLDKYYDSFKKIAKIAEEEEAEPEEEEEKELDRERRRRKNAARTGIHLESRWDYDRSTNIEQPRAEGAKDHESFKENLLKAERVLTSCKKQPLQAIGTGSFYDALEQVNEKTLGDRLSRLAPEAQQVLGEITTSKFEEQYPEYFEDFGQREIPMPPDYEELPPEQDFYIPEYDVGELLKFDEVGEEDKVKDEKKKLKDSEETLQKIRDIERTQKGKKKPITFDQVVGKASKKNKASTFYDLLLLAKQDKIAMKQKMPFGTIEINSL